MKIFILSILIIFSFIGFCRAGEDLSEKLLQEAYQIVKTTSEGDAYRRVSTLVWLADKCFKAGQDDKAADLLSKAFEISKILDKRDSILTEIALEYAKEGQYDQALKVAKEINDRSKIDFSVIKATALVGMADNYFKANPNDKAFDLLSQAFSEAKNIRSDINKKDNAFAAVALQYIKVGEYDQALQLTKTMYYPLTKAITLTNIAEAYLRSGQKDKVSDMLSPALEAVNASNDSSSYNRGIALAQIGIKYAQIGQYEQALKIAQSIDDAYGKATALAGTSLEYLKVGQKDKAQEVLSLALKEAKNIYDYPSYNSVDPLVDIYVTAGRREQALEIAQTIEDPLTRAFELAIIASAQQTDK